MYQALLAIPKIKVHKSNQIMNKVAKFRAACKSKITFSHQLLNSQGFSNNIIKWCWTKVWIKECLQIKDNHLQIQCNWGRISKAICFKITNPISIRLSINLGICSNTNPFSIEAELTISHKAKVHKQCLLCQVSANSN